jgi:hypothetical protein
MTMTGGPGASPKKGLPARAALATEYGDLLKIVFVFCAALWAWHEYRNKQEDTRIERMVEYTKRAGTGEFLRAELKLIEHWTNPDILQQLKSLPKRDTKKFGEFIIDNVEKSSLKPHVWKMLRLYDSLATCVNVEVCDRRATCNTFKAKLDIFVENYSPYFEKHRDEYHHDALASIRTLLAHKDCVAADPPASCWLNWLWSLCNR